MTRSSPRRRTRGLVAVLVLAARTAAAQPADPTPADRCKAAVDARGGGATQAYCRYLAVDVVTKIREKTQPFVASKIELAAAQPRITDTPGAQLSAGQTAAVASGLPVATTGGSVAAVGDTGQGLQLVTTLAINPASLAIGKAKRSVWVSRLADVSIVLPLAVDSAGANQKAFPYVGGRVRFNTLAAIYSRQLERDTVGLYEKVQTTIAELLPVITSALEAAQDPGRCASAIESGREADQRSFCGGAIDIAPTADSTAKARDALAQFREDTDRKYLTVEGRIDRGDLNGDETKDNDVLLAGYLAGGYGISAPANGVALEMRGRGGAVYFRDGVTERTRTAGFLAVGLEFALVRDLKRYCATAALELMSGSKDEMPATTTANAVRLGMAVPLDDGKVISVGATIPIDGSAATIAVSGDWSLLFSR